MIIIFILLKTNGFEKWKSHNFTKKTGKNGGNEKGKKCDEDCKRKFLALDGREVDCAYVEYRFRRTVCNARATGDITIRAVPF